MNAIHTEDLTKYYGKSRGIIQVNLNVPEGDFFGFIGPNGAGKSTTIRILLGLISASGGTAELFGKNIRDNKEEILSLTGYMPSEASFYGNMKTGDLIRYSADLRGLDCSKEASELGKENQHLVSGKQKETVHRMCPAAQTAPVYTG